MLLVRFILHDHLICKLNTLLFLLLLSLLLLISLNIFFNFNLFLFITLSDRWLRLFLSRRLTRLEINYFLFNNRSHYLAFFLLKFRNSLSELVYPKHKYLIGLFTVVLKVINHIIKLRTKGTSILLLSYHLLDCFKLRLAFGGRLIFGVWKSVTKQKLIFSIINFTFLSH